MLSWLFLSADQLFDYSVVYFFQSLVFQINIRIVFFFCILFLHLMKSMIQYSQKLQITSLLSKDSSFYLRENSCKDKREEIQTLDYK